MVDLDPHETQHDAGSNIAAQLSAGGVVRENEPTRHPPRPNAGVLPLELTSFIGRRNQRFEVKKALSTSRLVTLTGVGGVGKTRLATQVSTELLRNYADGVRLAEFGDLHDSALVVDTIAAAAGLWNIAGRTSMEALIDNLVPRKILLVLDNCEHLVETIAEVVNRLLRACPGLSILATSREILGVSGESVLPISPLGLPDPSRALTIREASQSEAVQLFVERAVAIVPGFELNHRNWRAVSSICTRLDGLPLAIELATSRLRTLSVGQIFRRLDARYTLLTKRSRNVPTRQQTLWWCIEWSYDLCAPWEQQLWTQLSVFAHNFDLEAVEAICSTTTDEVPQLDIISGLVDKSILIREESDIGVRFRMLDTIQAYGRTKLEESGTDQELARLHSNWYESLAFAAEAEWISPHQLEWQTRLKQDLPNLRKALEFDICRDCDAGMRMAAALYAFWFLGGRITEGRSWLDRTLTHSADRHSRNRAKAVYAACMLAVGQEDIAAAESWIVELNSLAQQLNTTETSVWAAVADGFIALVRGDLSRAVDRLEEATELVNRCSDPILMMMDARLALGWAYQLQGDFLRATEYHHKTLNFVRSRGERAIRSWVLWAMGMAVWCQGEPDSAADLLKDGLRHARMTEDPLIAAATLEALSWISSDRGDARRAAVLMGAADALGRTTGGSTVFFPNLAVYHESCAQRVHEKLGDREYQLAHKTGVAMNVAAAAAFGLEENLQPAAPETRAASILTKREQAVAELVSDGLTNNAIAERLVIARRTAEGHVERILMKLGFTSRSQIARWIAEQRSAEEDFRNGK
ncbi:ATP-binding protein [Prescottella equi]|uniref:ATP-binding protein n=1 Tax=Rhodococcus hoagii TaxID=43767 RepID=UPI00301DDDB6